MNANTSLISRLFPLSFALPSHLLFFYYFPPIFFFLCFFTFSFFFNRHVIRYDDTHTRRRTNRTSVIIIHASCFWSIYIYIFFFSFQIDIVNCQFDSHDYHLSRRTDFPNSATRKKSAKEKKEERKSVFEFRATHAYCMPIVSRGI